MWYKGEVSKKIGVSKSRMFQVWKEETQVQDVAT